MRDSYTLYQDKLQGEYLEAFKQINLYFGTQQVDDDTKEEYMGDLLDIFLITQEEGKPVEKITGKNLEHFCKSFCSNLTWKQKVLKVLDRLKIMAWFTFLMAAPELLFSIGDIVNGKVNIFELTSDINIFGYILGFCMVDIVAAITDAITKKVMFKIKKVSMMILQIIIIVLAIVSFIAYLILYFGDSIWDIPLWSAALVSGLYLLLYYIFNKKRLDSRKEHEVNFWDEIKKETEFNTDSDNLFAQEIEKRWEKRNKKRLKQGKQAFTREEILALEEAEILKAEANQWAYWLFPIVIIVGFLIFGEFETQTDMYWFAGIMLVVEYVLMALFWKVAKSGNINTRKWIEAERKKLTQANNDEDEV